MPIVAMGAAVFGQDDTRSKEEETKSRYEMFQHGALACRLAGWRMAGRKIGELSLAGSRLGIGIERASFGMFSQKSHRNGTPIQ
jgi:hypothetical protein